MPWLNPFLSDWGGWAERTVVRGWPNVLDERGNISYWFVNQGPGVAPMMARYVTRFFSKRASFDALYTELLTTGAGGGVYVASSGRNVLSQQIDLTVKDWATPHPVIGTRGVAFTFVYSRLGFADDVTNELFYRVPVPGDLPCPFALDNPEGLATPDRPNEWTTSFVPGQDTDWDTENTSNVCQFKAISSGRTIPNN